MTTSEIISESQFFRELEAWREPFDRKTDLRFADAFLKLKSVILFYDETNLRQIVLFGGPQLFRRFLDALDDQPDRLRSLQHLLSKCCAGITEAVVQELPERLLQLAEVFEKHHVRHEGLSYAFLQIVQKRNGGVYTALLESALPTLIYPMQSQLGYDLENGALALADADKYSRIAARSSHYFSTSDHESFCRVCVDFLRLYYGIDLRHENLLIDQKLELPAHIGTILTNALFAKIPAIETVQALKAAAIPKELWAMYVRSTPIRHAVLTKMLTTQEDFLRMLPELLIASTKKLKREQRL